MTERGSLFKRYEIPHDQGFTSIPNRLITAKNLTPEARLTLIYLIHNRPDWTIYQRKMMQDLGYGEEKMKNALRLLQKEGYLRRTQTKINGKFSNWIYEYHYDPIFLECSQVPVHSVDKSEEKAITGGWLPGTGKVPPIPISIYSTTTLTSSKTNDGNMDALRAQKKQKAKTLDLPSRFKLDPAQRETLALMKRSGINSPEATLCFYAKRYTLAQVAGALEEMKQYRPDNPGGYFRSLLMKGVDPKTSAKALNSAFAYEFKDSAGWGSLKIGKSHVEAENVKISLLLKSEDFANALIGAYDNIKPSS